MTHLDYLCDKATQIHMANRFRSCLETISADDVRRIVKAQDGIKLRYEDAYAVAKIIHILHEVDTNKH